MRALSWVVLMLARAGACNEPVTVISFIGANLTRSNLGGLGGRCVDTTDAQGRAIAWSERCDEEQSPSTPHELYLRGVGSVCTPPQCRNVDLRITNESVYRAWTSMHNGIKRSASGAAFGALNLLGPRHPSSRPESRVWRSFLTLVQLRFNFIDGATGAPLTLARTAIAFVDFDTGVASADGNTTAVEMLQVGPQAESVLLPTSTSLNHAADWAPLLSPPALVDVDHLAGGAAPSNASGEDALGGGGAPSNASAEFDLSMRRSGSNPPRTSDRDPRNETHSCGPCCGQWGIRRPASQPRHGRGVRGTRCTERLSTAPLLTQCMRPHAVQCL
jgi:hypothetical protein